MRGKGQAFRSAGDGGEEWEELQQMCEWEVG